MSCICSTCSHFRSTDENQQNTTADEQFQVVDEFKQSDLLTQRTKLLRSMIASLRSTALRSGGRKKGQTRFRNDVLSSSLGSNFHSYDSSGVFQFTNRVYVPNGLLTTAGGLLTLGVSLDPTVPTQWSSQSNLFDEFRIDEIRFSLIPTLSSCPTDNTVAICIDDDAVPGTSVPSSMDAMLQYGNAWWGNSRALPGSYCGGAKVPAYTYKCAPPSLACTPDLVSGAIVGTNLGSWGDIGSAGTAHMGMLFCRSDALLTVSSSVASYVLEYVMQFRQVR